MQKATDLISDWMGFYQSIGVQPEALTGKHSQCPICNSEGSFRTAIRQKPGVWVCSHCTSSSYSSPLEFVRRFCQLSTYKEAAAEIIRRAGCYVEPVRKEYRQPAPVQFDQSNFEKEVRKRNWIWERLAVEVSENDPVWKYLNFRIPGIESIPKSIRYLPNAEYWDFDEHRRPFLLGVFPAMLVRGFDAKGNCVQLHTTYLTQDGRKADVQNPKKTRTAIAGATSFCFRLSPIDESGVLGLTEGIETALACEHKFKHAVWPCHSNTVLANFEIPESLFDSISKIVIYADNDGWRIKPNGDRWNPGVTKARELAEKLRQVRRPNGQRMRVQICYTSRVGDFADSIINV
ncbi:toprim domain-containing protein (plasmid) [Comamonas aquatica]|nr:toprim domain-containing protein [Comamonas aquatica]